MGFDFKTENSEKVESTDPFRDPWIQLSPSFQVWKMISGDTSRNLYLSKLRWASVNPAFQTWNIYIQYEAALYDSPLGNMNSLFALRNMKSVIWRIFVCGESVSDHFVYAPNQWEIMLQCNIISHWLMHTQWSLTSYIANTCSCSVVKGKNVMIFVCQQQFFLEY